MGFCAFAPSSSFRAPSIDHAPDMFLRYDGFLVHVRCPGLQQVRARVARFDSKVFKRLMLTAKVIPSRGGQRIVCVWRGCVILLPCSSRDVERYPFFFEISSRTRHFRQPRHCTFLPPSSALEIWRIGHTYIGKTLIFPCPNTQYTESACFTGFLAIPLFSRSPLARIVYADVRMSGRV